MKSKVGNTFSPPKFQFREWMFVSLILVSPAHTQENNSGTLLEPNQQKLDQKIDSAISGTTKKWIGDSQSGAKPGKGMPIPKNSEALTATSDANPDSAKSAPPLSLPLKAAEWKKISSDSKAQNSPTDSSQAGEPPLSPAGPPGTQKNPEANSPTEGRQNPTSHRVAYRSTSSINESISPVLAEIMQEYFLRNQEDPTLFGNAVLTFKIKPNGDIFWLKVSYTTVKDTAFIDFVLNTFKKCRFDPVDSGSKPISMIFPLIFQPLDG